MTDTLAAKPTAHAEQGPTDKDVRRLKTLNMIFELRAFIALAVLIVVFSSLSDSFLTVTNLITMTKHVAINAILALGMLLVILKGGIDLSVGSMVAATAVAGGQLVDQGSLAFILGAIGMGVLLGGINAGAIAYGKVVPFIATLAMFTMARGLALWISDKQPVSLFDLESVRWFGNGEVLGIPGQRGTTAGSADRFRDPACRARRQH